MPGAERTFSAPPLDASSVGQTTIARTELIDVRRALTFAAGIHAPSLFLDDADLERFQVHPGLAFALQFNAQGRLGKQLDSSSPWLGAVHAESDLRFARPFRIGDQITTQGRLVARRQLPGGVLNVERYAMRDGAGDLVAELDFGIIFRGSKLEGGDRELAPAPPLPHAPDATIPLDVRTVQIARTLLHHYTACSGIYAPIHTLRDTAANAGFADIILQGSAAKAIALSEIVVSQFGGDANRVRRLYAQLRHVVPADTALRIEILAREDKRGLRTVFFRGMNHKNEIALAKGCVVGSESGAS